MQLYQVFTYEYFFVWFVLAVFSYIYNSNFIYEPLLAFLTGTALYYSYVAVTNYKLPIYFKGLFLFVTTLTLYGIFLVVAGDDIYWQATGRVLRKYLYVLYLYKQRIDWRTGNENSFPNIFYLRNKFILWRSRTTNGLCCFDARRRN